MRLPSFATRDGRALSGATLYALSNGWEAALQVLVIPLVTRAMPVAVFGQFALLYVSIPVLLLLVDLGGSLAAVRQLAQHPAPEERARIVSSYFWPRAVMAGALGALIGWVAPAVPLERLLGPESRAAVPYLALTFVTAVLYDATVESLRGQERHRESASAMLIRSTSRALALIGLVVVGDGGLPALFGALALANTVALLFGASCLGRQLLHSPSLGLYLDLLRFGLPTAMMFFVRIALDLDRYLVRALTGIDSAGLYQLAGVPAMGVEMVNRVGAFPIEPYVYGADSTERARAFARVTRLYFFGVGTTAFTLALFSPEVLRILAPPEYASAVVAVPPLLFASACSGAIRIVGIGAGVAHRPRAWAIASIAELVTAVTLMALVASQLGLGGIAAMRFCGGVVGLLVCHQIAIRAWPVRLPVLRAIAFFVAGTVAASVTTGGWELPLLPLVVRALVWCGVTGLGAVLLATFRLPDVESEPTA